MRTAISVALAVLAAQSVLPAAAQTIDPRVLQQLQGQLGSGPNTAAPSALDRARTSDDRGVSSAAQVPTPRVDTIEEQELRRAQARTALERLYRPSAVEREFRERLADPTLRQFGYDLFQSATGASSGGLTGSVGGNYTLGIGDDVVVQFQGATNDSKTVRVDREGRIVVGTLPPIPAAGRSIDAVTRDLQAVTRRTLLGTDVYVSLGSVRAVTVFVGGEVDRPGQYNLTALSDISAALAQAGGVRRSGSLRSVRIVRAGGSQIVDLYGLLGIGAPPSVRLRDGDRIIVPVIGDTVAISGNVARPGIYEVRRGTSVGSLLGYAGGALRPRGNTVAISRIGADGQESFIRAASLSSALIPGDGVQLTGGSAGGAVGRVVLRGYVANPGPRALVSTPTVRDLLGEVSDLKFDTYLPLAVLIRRDPATAARVFQPVNLLEALRSRPGVALRSDDRLYVFSRSDVDFLNRTAVRRVVLGQPNPLHECVSLDRLQALVGDTQSSRFNVVTRGAFVVERGGQSDIAATGGSLAVASRTGESGFRTGDEAGLARTARRDDALPGDVNARPDPVDIADDDLAGVSARRARDTGRCPAVFEEEPELLPVLIENAVGVGGAVRRPGAYPVAGAVSAGDIAAAAEGVIGGSRGMTLDVTSSDGTDATEQKRVAVDGYPTAFAATIVRAGDDLRFNAAQPQYEAGGVLLAGEFSRPGLYAIRKGETLAQLVARAGGVTSLAYPYGAIFTRRSVKELQQEGLRRTGRELSTALLSVAARSKDANGGAIVAGQQLIAQLQTVEAPGRVVIEADPRVLALRPDLDTVLESGDAVVMPKHPNFVLALGDVLNPGALQFIPGKTAAEYVIESGGIQRTADKHRIFVVLPNGSSRPLRNARGWGQNKGFDVPPGSTIIVPKDIDPLYALDVARDVTGIIGSLFTSLATLAVLATR